MAKEKKFVESITSRDVDFAQWYTDVVREAKLCNYSSVKGCLNYKALLRGQHLYTTEQNPHLLM